MNDLERLVLDHTEQMILLVEPQDLRIVMANRVAVQCLGYSEAALLEKTILDVESALQDVFYWEEVRAGQYSDIESGEGLYLCADGSMRSATKSVKVVERSGHRWLLVQAREVHDEYRIEDDLARTMSQLRATLESTGNGILVIDWQGRIGSMNRLFSAMWKLPEELLLRQDDAAIIDFMSSGVVDEDVIRRRLQEIVESTETDDILHLKDGRVFQCKSLPQYLEDRIIGRVFGFSDITDRIRIEQDLIAARERAESANQAKAAFLAMMSHEIRTPMNGVMGVAELMLDTPLNSDQKRYLDIIRSSSESLLSIINDILDFSKIEARKLTLEAIDFNLLDLLEDLADLYALRAADKGLEYSWSIASDVPAVLRGDPGRIRQILTNLIGNALKFTTAGGVSLRVKRIPGRQERVLLHMEVEDTGIGIASESLGRIFAPFEQSDSTTTRRYGGTGLGLSICKQLVELMDGSISVVSQENMGTTFSLEIKVDGPASGAAEEDADAQALREFRGVRMLVVDDDPTTLAGMVSLLERWRFPADGVTDAKAALAAIGKAREQGESYRCVFIDSAIRFDGEDAPGQQLFEPQPDAGPVSIPCVPAGSRDEARRFERDGVRFYLHKPVRRAMLRDCLLAILGRPVEKEEKTGKAASAQRSDAWKQTVRLLVVEDNVINTMVLLGVLGKLGFSRIDKARDGLEAVEAVGKERYDLILMDCQMPRLDGYDATRRLRERGIATPIVAMTAHALSGDREKCLAAGMNDYLTKPVVIESLAACLDKWLGAVALAEFQQPGLAQDVNGDVSTDFRYSEFLELVLGDAELADTLLKMFVDTTPDSIERLRNAIATGDGIQIKSAAHFIKGAAANLCALELRDAAYGIEIAGMNGNMEQAISFLAQLEAKWGAFTRHPRVRPLISRSA